MLELVMEGSPYTLLVIVVGFGATATAILQCLARSKPWGGLVLGLLAAHLALMLAFSTYALAMALGAVAGADAASKATAIAFGVSTAASVLLVGGGLGAFGAAVGIVGAAIGPDRRVELALRAAALFVTFVALAEMARRVKFTMSVIAGSEPESRGAIAFAGLGESFDVLPMGLGLAFLLAIAAGAASTMRARAA